MNDAHCSHNLHTQPLDSISLGTPPRGLGLTVTLTPNTVVTTCLHSLWPLYLLVRHPEGKVHNAWLGGVEFYRGDYYPYGVAR